MKQAKAKALEVAIVHGWGADVTGHGYAFRNDSVGMDFILIFEFGSYGRTREWNGSPMESTP